MNTHQCDELISTKLNQLCVSDSDEFFKFLWNENDGEKIKKSIDERYGNTWSSVFFDREKNFEGYQNYNYIDAKFFPNEQKDQNFQNNKENNKKLNEKSKENDEISFVYAIEFKRFNESIKNFEYSQKNNIQNQQFIHSNVNDSRRCFSSSSSESDFEIIFAEADENIEISKLIEGENKLNKRKFIKRRKNFKNDRICFYRKKQNEAIRKGKSCSHNKREGINQGNEKKFELELDRKKERKHYSHRETEFFCESTNRNPGSEKNECKINRRSKDGSERIATNKFRCESESIDKKRSERIQRFIFEPRQDNDRSIKSETTRRVEIENRNNNGKQYRYFSTICFDGECEWQKNYFEYDDIRGDDKIRKNTNNRFESKSILKRRDNFRLNDANMKCVKKKNDVSFAYTQKIFIVENKDFKTYRERFWENFAVDREREQRKKGINKYD